VVTYSAPGEAPATRDSTGDSRFNRLWTLLGVPCATVPFGHGARGLPTGIQVMAGFGRDAQVISAAKAIEKLVERG
jgi:Asp-tRNA(Asn)/Glu-tRNA(Gln) amidotransferase A subunit family amidase